MRLLPLSIAGILLLWGAAAGRAQAEDPPVISSGSSVEYCLRCHGMETLAQTSELGNVRNLSIRGEAYKASVHAAKNCTFCHYGFGDFPHPAKALARKKPQCTTCHRGEKYASWGFEQVGEEFEKSVHVAKLGEKMTCFSCHDPHLFDPSGQERPIQETISYSNGICLECHGNLTSMTARFAVATRPLDITHAFLPNRELHWRTVRCLDCHTPQNERMVSHEILPKEQAVRNCVECHSQESRLLTKLYRHRVGEERQTAGFLNSVVLNDAYIVGMTRNRYLDWLSIVLASITALGIALHALGRYVAKRREKRG